jgi:hypothetical protein
MKSKQYLRQLQNLIGFVPKEETQGNDYSYPASDEKTNQTLEELQDPGMRLREQTIYRDFLRDRCGLLIDFGCGTGANFKCFDSPENSDAVLLGIEPDPARSQSAMSKLKLLQYIEATVVNSDVSFLSKIPHDIKIDSILCSQVLGHVSQAEMERILTAFASSLSSDGQCLITIPIVGEAFSVDPSSHGWKPGSDYLHLVDLSVSPFEANYRTKVDDTYFNEIASHPQKDLLPVRCFWIEGLPSDMQINLPIKLSVDALPPTLRNLVESYFEVVNIYLYSIHKLQSDVVGVGDIFVALKPRSA